MKMQLEDHHLRLRADEEELARLLSGEAIVTKYDFGGAFSIECNVRLQDTDAPSLTGRVESWRILLPRAAVASLAARLPSRDGLEFGLGGGSNQPMTLRFDVDVRDSVRRRHPRG